MKTYARKALTALVVILSLTATLGATPASAGTSKAWGGDVEVSKPQWSGYSCSFECDVNLGSYRYIRVRVDCEFPSRDYYSDWMTADEIEGRTWGKRCRAGAKRVQVGVEANSSSAVVHCPQDDRQFGSQYGDMDGHDRDRVQRVWDTWGV